MKRTLLLTGASSGIGRAIAEKMLLQGNTVVAISRQTQVITEKIWPHPIKTVQLDLANLDSLPQAIKMVLQDQPAIDGLISCAGRGEFANLEEFSYRQIRQFVDLNLLSHFFLARALLPHLKQKQFGDIIFIGSDAALQGKKKASLYCACKFALRGLAQSLRAECGNSGVRVSIVHPGMTDTPFYASLGIRPGADATQHLRPMDIATAIAMVLQAPAGTVFDEIVLSPLNKVVAFKKDPGK